MDASITFLSALFVENLVGEGKAHKAVVAGNTDGHSRNEGEGGTHNSFEDGYKAHLHTHVDEVGEGEAQPLLGVGISVKSKIIGENEIEDEADAVAYQCGGYCRNPYGIYEYYVDAVLQQRGYAAHDAEAHNLTDAPLTVDECLECLHLPE